MANTHKLLIDEENTPTVCDSCYQLALDMMPGIICSHVQTVPNVRYCEKCGKEETTEPFFRCDTGNGVETVTVAEFDAMANEREVTVFQVKRVTNGSYACYLNGAYVGSIEQNSEAIRYEDGKLHHYWNLHSVMYGYIVHCDRYYRDIRNMAEGYFVREIAESRRKCAESSCWNDAGEFGLCDSCQSLKDAREAYERNPMGCAKCGAATRYEFCVACESDILETMLNETVSNTECAKCGVSFNAEIDTEGNLCPACYWHAKHYKMPYIDYPAYVESLKEMGFDVPKPNRVYEFDSHNFQGFQDGKPYNVTLIDTGFGNPLYCISNTFREHAPMGFERHASGVINCYVKRSLLALPEWSTCQHTHWYRVRFADNGKDNGYRNHVRAHSPNDARRMVLRDGEWNGHDNREIVSVECFTDYPEPEFETNTYRGLDVGAYGDY